MGIGTALIDSNSVWDPQSNGRAEIRVQTRLTAGGAAPSQSERH
jgi:hypothetical protein